MAEATKRISNEELRAEITSVIEGLMASKNSATKAQEAFLEVLVEKFGIDQEQLQRVSETQKTRGKTYLTISWAFALTLTVSGWLLIRVINQIDDKLTKFEDRQNDVRERLRTLEDAVRRLEQIIYFGRMPAK